MPTAGLSSRSGWRRRCSTQACSRGSRSGIARALRRAGGRLLAARRRARRCRSRSAPSALPLGGDRARPRPRRGPVDPGPRARGSRDQGRAAAVGDRARRVRLGAARWACSAASRGAGGRRRRWPAWLTGGAFLRARPGRPRPALQPLHAAARRARARRRPAARPRGRRRRRRGLRGRRQPADDGRQRLRHGSRRHQARRALRHAPARLLARRGRARRRARARARALPRRAPRPAVPRPRGPSRAARRSSARPRRWRPAARGRRPCCPRSRWRPARRRPW